MNATREIELGKLRLGGGNPLFLIAGPCVIETESHARTMAEKIAKIAADAELPYIFKASFDKANRSSLKGFRGPGLKEGLRILSKIKSELKLPILTDIHETSQAAPAAEVCDVLQIPAFLARQTDLLLAAGKTGRVINVKKPQFVSPWEMGNVAEKVASTVNEKIILTEREMSLNTARGVLKLEAQAIHDVLARLDATFEKAVSVLFACKGRVVVTGMGKSGLIGRKISATLSSTGTPSFFLHPAEALHGDLGMLARGDAMLAVSYGGQAQAIVRLLEAPKRLAISPVAATWKTD